jgi:peptidoglycan/xylan/chitin deacetylase (PgdA/CDA1 family)
MKTQVLQALRVCGIFALARALSAGRPRVLVYHNFSASGEGESPVSVACLRNQLEYLRRHFHVVKLSELCRQLAVGRPARRLLALTVDDGRRNFYEFLFPLLKELQLPATFFVVSSFISKQDWLWTDKVLWLSRQPNPAEELSSDRLPTFFAMLNDMQPEARNACIEALAQGMGHSIPKHAPPQYAPCSWDELREMCDSNLVEIGSHTVTHPILSTLRDHESAQEIATSRSQLEEQLGRSIEVFAIPNGTPKDYRPSQVKQIREAGYVGAAAAWDGLVEPGTDPYQLPRIGIANWTDHVRFTARVDGVEHYRSQLRRAVRAVHAGTAPRKAGAANDGCPQAEPLMTSSRE